MAPEARDCNCTSVYVPIRARQDHLIYSYFIPQLMLANYSSNRFSAVNDGRSELFFFIRFSLLRTFRCSRHKGTM